MGITGILSAIAIPQYNRYRANAARGAFDATGSNVARAFGACVAVNTFGNCDSLTEINIATSYDTNEGRLAPFFCVDMETEIGGTTFKGCVSSNAQTGAVANTFNQQICYTDVTTGTVMVGATTVTCATGFDAGGVCDTQISPLTLCTTNADCTGAMSGNLCGRASTATCGATTGTCT